jgi:adenylate cyclase
VEDRLPRKLAAILYADVAGYSRLTGEDEDTTHRALSEYFDLIAGTIETHRGQVMHYAGDAVLAKFHAIVDAMSAAVAIQNELRIRNEDVPDERKVQFRIGVNSGDVIEDRGDIYGDGVNVAARLESLAEPGGTCISESVRTAVGKKLDLGYEYMGEQKVKNIEEPVRAYRVVMEEERESKITSMETPTLKLPDKPSIAVLAFTNMSGDSEQEYFSDGISEDIITALSKISKLFVVARNSTFTYKGRAVDVKQVGREQGVRYVLEGSVRRGGDRLRITAQLVDATTGHHLWAQRYDRMVQDVFELQDEITREVTSALQVELTEGEQARLWASGTQNLEAWEIVIQIPELLYSHRRGNVLISRRLAKQALQLDKYYAAAWTMVGLSYWEETFNGWSENPDASLNLAMDAAAHSQSIDPSNPNTYALLTWIHLSLRKYDQAFDLGQKAMVLGPNNSFVMGVASDVALFCNRPHDMVVLLNKAMRLCPIYPAWYPSSLAWAYLLMNRREDAIASAQTSIDIDSDYPFNYMVLAIAFAELEREQEARTALENLLRIDPKYSLRTFSQSQPFRDAEVLDRHIEGLRKAGLPE